MAKRASNKCIDVNCGSFCGATLLYAKCHTYTLDKFYLSNVLVWCCWGNDGVIGENDGVIWENAVVIWEMQSVMYRVIKEEV